MESERRCSLSLCAVPSHSFFISIWQSVGGKECDMSWADEIGRGHKGIEGVIVD